MKKDYQKKDRKRNQRPNNDSKKPKEVEENIERNKLNYADLGIKGCRRGKDNDVSWYSKNEALLRDAASFPFGVPLGTQLPTTLQANLSQFNGVTVSIDPPIQSVPGVCAIRFVPTIGISDNTYSAANLAARNIYSFVRHANSGSANYDSPDLMMYLLATDSCFSFYAMMVRAYGVMQTYSATNRYMPKVLIQAMGLDYNDLLQNLAQFRYFINQYALKLGALAVPGDMSYIERHIWMNSNVYSDSENWKAQTYLYVQAAYYTFVEQTQGPGYLEYTSWASMGAGTQLQKLQSVMNFANALIEPLLASEDIGIMSGDILKAFGRDNLFFVNMIAEDYSVVPGYSAEVLSQFENTTVLGYPSATPLVPFSRDIKQIVTGSNAGAITQHFYFENTSATVSTQARVVMLALPRILNMHKSDPTAGDVIVATRLMNIATNFGYSDNPNPYVIWEVDQTGSEVAAEVFFYTIGRDGTTTSVSNSSYGVIATSQFTARLQSAAAVFDWAPQFAVVSVTGKDVALQGYTTDFDNYTTLSVNDLTRLHDTALLSEFDVPQMARLSTRPMQGR